MKLKSQLTLVSASFLVVGVAVASQCQYSGQARAASQGKTPKVNKVIAVTEKKPAFTVTLSSNATTGYSWFLLSCDNRLVTPLSARYIPPKNKKMMGAPGQMQWQFQVTPAGLAVPRVITLELGYLRPWQPASIAERYLIDVVTQ